MLSSSRMLIGASRLSGSIATNISSRNMANLVPAYATYNNLSITQPSEFVYNLELNRPKKMNALNMEMWGEIGNFFERVGEDSDCRVVVLSATGKMFTSGIDLVDLSELASVVYSDDDVARKCTIMYNKIRKLQRQFSTLEQCPKPIIGAVHSACIGGGVDLICGADIRMCTEDAWFQVKEVDMGLAADVGTLQRLPRAIGSQSIVNELCLTARKLKSAEAEKIGFVSKVYPTKEDMMSSALEMAASIAAKSPVAVQGTKVNLIYSREHSPDEGLDYMARFNMAMLQSEDVMKSAMANMDKEAPPPQFAKL